jgi:hypothetical protein
VNHAKQALFGLGEHTAEAGGVAGSNPAVPTHFLKKFIWLIGKDNS